MTATCVVTRNGSSASVVLPAEWRKENGVEVGDVLEIGMDVRGQIMFRKPRSRVTDGRFDRLLSLVGSLPDVPWTNGDLPSDDKMLLGERDA